MKFMSYYSAIILRTFLNRFFKIILFVFFLILPTVVFGGSWNVVWQEDFGVVEDSVCRDFADPNMSVPGHKVADVELMGDGYYGITNSTAWSFIHKKSVNSSKAYHFVPGRDHTGNTNGGMLVVNVGSKGKGESIYENELKLKPCGNHKYMLSMFVANVSDASLSPNLTLQVYNVKDAANPELLESVNLSGSDVVAWPGDEKNSLGLYTHKERDWSEASLEFEAKSGDVLKIVIQNHCSSGNGNDFALDDITLQRYDDEEIIPPTIEINNELTNQLCVPVYALSNDDVLKAWRKIYHSIYCLWQYSTNDGYTWTNIPDKSGIEKFMLQRDLPTTGKEVYRLIITGGSDDSEAESKAEYIAKYETPNDECDYFSISNIISQMEIKDPPVAYLRIDNNQNITNQPVYNCDKETHMVTLNTNEWDNRFTQYYMLWQYSYDETTWTDLPFTGSDFQFTDDFDGLTYFRVILAANENTLAQVAKNGTPDNCDKDYFVTNTVSIECLESCKKPEFEVLPDQNKLICEDSDDLVEWKVRQTNQTKSIDIEWYSKATGENTWTLIAGENGESISLPNPKNTTSYLFLAKNGECVSDSIIFELTMIPIFRFDPIGDIDICEGTDVTFTPDVKTRPLSPIIFFWDGVPTIELQHIVLNITEDKTVVFYATDGVCTSNEVYANFIVEKETDVTLQPLPAVICEGEKVDLIADAKFSPFNNFKWEKDGVLFNNTDLITSDIPHENTIYKFIVEGNLCPTIEYILGVDVEKKAEMTLQPLPAVVCKGEKVDLVADAKLTSTNSFRWEKNGNLLSDVDLATTDIPEENVTYKFTILGDACPNIEDKMIVEVESMADVTLQPLPAIICEGEKVDLIADAKLTSTNAFKWEKGNDLISDADLSTSDIPTEDATYKFTITGDKCPTIEKELSVKVEKKADVTLEPLPAIICEGTDVDLVAHAKLTSANTFKWEKGNDLLTDIGLKTTDIPTEDATYKFTITGEKCPAIEKEVSVKVEKMADVTLQPLPAIICEGEKVDLIADAKLTSTNRFKWEKGNDLISDADLSTSDIPTEDATYKFTITGDKCPAIEKEISVKVEKKADVTLEPLPAIICEGTDVDLVADVKLTSANTFKWEKGNDLLTDIGLKTTDIPTEDATYKFTITGEKCLAIEKEVSVKVEKMADVTLQPLPAIICEGEKVDLIADAKLTSTNRFKWEKGNDLISDADLSTSDIPTEDATYKFTITGDKCPAIEKEVSVKVEKKTELSLSISDTEVCENSSVVLSVNATNAPKLVWKQKNDGESQFSEMAESGDVVNITATKSATFIVESSDELACQSAVSNEVSLFVEEPVSVLLENVPTEVCEGTTVLLNASITENCTSYGWKKNENENFAKNELTAEDVPTETTTYEFWAKPLVCPTFSEKFVVDVEHVKNVELTTSESRICKDENVTLATNYPYTEGIIWASKGENESQFSKVDEGVSEIVVSPSDNTTYRVSAISKLGCEEKGSEQEIEVVQPVGLSVEDASICEGDAAHLEAVTERAYDRIEWKIEGDSSVNKVGSFVDLTPESTITYNVVAYSHNCPEEVNATVTVAPIPRISSHEEIGNHTYQMNVENTNETLYFDYHNGDGKTISNLLENAVVGKFYDVEVSDSLGCSSSYQFRVPFIEPEFPIYFYQGDENWVVENIEIYPNSVLYIYDRFGKLLFKEKGNTDGWSGEYNGRKLPSTDYWYILDVPEIDKLYEGHFTLMRR